MKIICDNCGAKYSIADEKVKGKVFKIRCKKCQESIVIRGDAQPEAAPAPAPAPEPDMSPPPMPADGGEPDDAETKVFDYSGYQGGGAADEAVWHIVVEGDQQGPYTATQLGEYISAGSLDWETFVWKEGFGDWLPIRDVEELVNAISPPDSQQGAAPAAAAAAPAAAAASDGLFDLSLIHI